MRRGPDHRRAVRGRRLDRRAGAAAELQSAARGQGHRLRAGFRWPLQAHVDDVRQEHRRGARENEGGARRGSRALQAPGRGAQAPGRYRASVDRRALVRRERARAEARRRDRVERRLAARGGEGARDLSRDVQAAAPSARAGIGQRRDAALALIAGASFPQSVGVGRRLFLTAERPVYSAPMAAQRKVLLSIAITSFASLAAGCVFVVPEDQLAGQFAAAETLGPRHDAERLPPLETRRFENVAESTEIVGDVQVIFARYENTFAKIARAYDIGYNALRRANPGVDDWLPGEGTPIYLPTSSILPSAPREGILINLPAMRLYHFEPARDSDEGEREVTITMHPIGIGREGWSTPT